MNFTYRQIWLINYPVMMSVLMEQLINITDAVFLGHVGELELGAAAIAGMYYMAVYMLGFGFSLGLQVVIARRNGEKKYLDTGKVFFQGLYFLLLLAVVLYVFSRISTPLILNFLLHFPEVNQAVMQYLDWRMPGLFFSFPALALRAYFVGITKTKVLSYNAIVLIGTNLMMNYLLIFGHGGIPALGISGAAMASSLAEGVSLCVLVIYAGLKIGKPGLGVQAVMDRGILSQVCRLSVWSMMQAFLCVAPWFLFFIAIEHLGKEQLAIANTIRSISMIFFVIVHSFALTTGSLVSNLIGAGEKSEVMPVCRKIMTLSYGTGIPLLILVGVMYPFVAGIYTTNAGMIEQAFPPFLVMLSNYFLAVPAYVCTNAVTGCGNTRFMFWIQVITVIVYLFYLWLISELWQVPLAVYWTAEHLYVLLLLIFALVFLRQGKWLKQV